MALRWALIYFLPPSVLCPSSGLEGAPAWWPGRGRQLPIAARAGGGEGTRASLQVRSEVNHPESGDLIVAQWERGVAWPGRYCEVWAVKPRSGGKQRFRHSEVSRKPWKVRNVPGRCSLRAENDSMGLRPGDTRTRRCASLEAEARGGISFIVAAYGPVPDGAGTWEAPSGSGRRIPGLLPQCAADGPPGPGAVTKARHGAARQLLPPTSVPSALARAAEKNGPDWDFSAWSFGKLASCRLRGEEGRGRARPGELRASV